MKPTKDDYEFEQGWRLRLMKELDGVKAQSRKLVDAARETESAMRRAIYELTLCRPVAPNQDVADVAGAQELSEQANKRLRAALEPFDRAEGREKEYKE